MRDLSQEEPQKVETIQQADKKFSIWDIRLFGDRRSKELHAQSHEGRIEKLESEDEQRDKLAKGIKDRLNQVLTWVLAAFLGGFGLWLFNRLVMGG